MGWQIYSWRRSPKNNLNRALEAQNAKTQNSPAPSPPSARLHPPNHGRRRRRRFHFGGATRRGVRRRGHPRGRRVRRGPPRRDGRGGGRGPDAIAEPPPLRRARAFLAMAKAAASLFAGRQLSRWPPSRYDCVTRIASDQMFLLLLLLLLQCGLGVRELIRMNTLSRRSL